MFEKLNEAIRSALGPMGHARTATKAAFRMSFGARMSTHRGGTYNTGISEQAVEATATEDGQAGILDRSNVGKNSYPHAVDHLVEGHETATSVISHDLRNEVQCSDEQLSHQKESVNRTEATAVEAIDEHTSAQRQWLVQRHLMRAAGLPIPGRRGFPYLVLLLLVLFVGEWGLLALGFQIMGLSDRPWIPFIAFTDDLHLAALSAVMALVYLGHIVGNHVRRIEHALEVRRQAAEERDNYPKPATFDYMWALAALTATSGGMFALSSIRTEYLKAMGVDANFWAFIGVQFVILAAAIGIGFAHANPDAEKWKSVDRALDSAILVRTKAVDNHMRAVGDFNALLDRRVAVMSKAGHHVDADAAHVRGQIAAYMRRYILTQLEPAQEELFEEHLRTTAYKDGDLLKRLAGVTPFPEFSMTVTRKVMGALAAALEEISTLRAQIDQIEINRLDLPGSEELFASKSKAAHGEAIDESANIDVEQTPEAPASPATKLHPVPDTVTIEDFVNDSDDAKESA